MSKECLIFLKWVCPVHSGCFLFGSVLSYPVGPKWVFPVLSESVLSKVGMSCPKWVCFVLSGPVLSTVSLFCPKWFCPLQSKAGLSCPKWACSLLSGSDLS